MQLQNWRLRNSDYRNYGARDIANDAKCALGSLYTAFHDIDELILHVNSMTLTALG